MLVGNNVMITSRTLYLYLFFVLSKNTDIRKYAVDLLSFHSY